ncbi:MAG: S9 family peptidase [Ignavibacteria bacterium]|nr:S9 family peptidase [Ignavibacteria bacterium]
MKTLALVFILGSTLSLAQVSYPETRRVDVRDTFHGTVVPDPYRWLEDDRDPEVERWVASQADVAEKFLAKIPFRAKMYEALDKLNSAVTYSAPWRRAGVMYFYKNTGRQNHSVLFRQPDGVNDPEVLLDPNTFAADGTISLAFASVSQDGKYLAYGKSQAGSDWRDIYVMDLATKRMLIDTITWVKNSGVSWYKNGFFYSRYAAKQGDTKSLTAKNSYQQVMYHRVGTRQSEDVLVFADASLQQAFIGCFVPEDSPYLFRTVRLAASNGNTVYIRHVDSARALWKKIWDSETDSWYPSHYHNGMLYGTSTKDAPTGKLIRLKDPLGRAEFETIVLERDYVLDDVSYGAGRIFLTWMKDVQHTVEIADMDGKITGTVALPRNGAVSGFDGRDTDSMLTYTFSSYIMPATIFEYDVKSNNSKVWQTADYGFDASQYMAEQVKVKSKDGTLVPMTVLWSKHISRDGNNPTLLYGYGGFNISQTPGFRPSYIALLNQGCVIAIANLRGGGEYGDAWHKAGTKTQKQNVFDDAIACAEWLIENKYTNPTKLALNGRSNGGLLVGAVVNQRPDLFRVAIPEVGVMDMLRFHKFTIGWNWQSDYGEITKSDEFRALHAYSPYHQLKSGVKYPSIMVMTADHDDRVVPAHSFKYAAQLQHVYSGTRPMLLRVETNSGHGAVNRQTNIKGTADKFCFMLYEMGVTPDFDTFHVVEE